MTASKHPSRGEARVGQHIRDAEQWHHWVKTSLERFLAETTHLTKQSCVSAADQRRLKVLHKQLTAYAKAFKPLDSVVTGVVTAVEDTE